MNNKETELQRIVDIVVACCSTDMLCGDKTITREDVLGRNRCENVVMTRCILAEQIVAAGYSVTTAAMVLHRTVQAVRHMFNLGASFNKTSRAYRIASDDAARKCREAAW